MVATAAADAATAVSGLTFATLDCTPQTNKFAAAVAAAPPPEAPSALDSAAAALPAMLQQFAFEDGLTCVFPTTSDARRRAHIVAMADARLDLETVGVWIAAIQTVAACAFQAATSVALPWLLPLDARAPLRTLVLSSLVGLGVVRAPLFPHLRDAAVVHLHKSQRLAVALIAAAWAAEAILHSDCNGVHGVGALRSSILAVFFVGLGLTSLHRALYPTSTADLAVFCSLVSCLAVCVVPQTLTAAQNPLGAQLGPVSAALRIVRCASWGAAYVATTIAATPLSPAQVDPAVLAARALAATAWVFVVPAAILTFVVPYLVILAVRRVKTPGHDWIRYTSDESAHDA